VAEISGGVDICHSIRGADYIGVDGSHTGIEQTADDGFVVNISVAVGNFDHGILADFFRAQHGELDADNTGWLNFLGGRHNFGDA